ncbi:MAG: 50S ribosomal protein L4 [bacterium]|nr:50S ribosomal protein L4 [Candidatus Sumerlaeota bacterium]
MATLNIRNSQGGDAGIIEVSDAIFAVEPNKNAVRHALLAYEANQRQGTHSTKTRGMVNGGGRKPYRQKGTGRARQGSIRAAQWRGGSIIFGPHPRDYNKKINKKVKRLALYSALSDIRSNNRIVLVDDFQISAPKTRAFAELLDRLGIGDARKILILLADASGHACLSSRNLSNVMLLPPGNVNIFDLLTCDYILSDPASIKKLQEQIGS